jgi:methylated-DNA-[protein]-cysteine S-methyltransferase
VEFTVDGGNMKSIKALQVLPQNATYDVMPSPVGKLTIVTSPDGLHALLWDKDHSHPECQQILKQFKRTTDEKIIVKTKKQLTEYFAGNRKIFDLPIVLHGTEFQLQAWRQLQKIPYAKAISYAEQATRMGDKNKARAVGMANGCNPISIIVPCHRVIGANGQLVGFGGGLDRKAYLLQLEQNIKN